MEDWQRGTAADTRRWRRVSALAALVVVAAGGAFLASRGPGGQDPGGQLRVDVGEDFPPGDAPRPPDGDGTDERWRVLEESPLSSRFGHVAVWTGAEMLVWGGERHGQPLTDGGAYDPVARTWRRLPPTGGADGGMRPSEVAAVWTGRDMVVLGPSSARAYRPGDDAWRALAPPPPDAWAPSTAGWTGEEVVVLAEGQRRAVGYDPDADRWRELPRPPLSGGRDTTAVELLGTLVVVGAGQDGPAISRYDPVEDTWSEPSAAPAAAAGAGPWSPDAAADPVGGRVLFAGPAEAAERPAVWAWSPDEGWQRAADLPASLAGVPVEVVWTGREIVAWVEGQPGASLVSPSFGARWRRIPAGPLPPRRGSTAVWTGEELLVWGGLSDGEPVAVGAALRPRGHARAPVDRSEVADVTGTWRRLPAGPLPADGPPPGPPHVAWTGTEVLVLDEFSLAAVATYHPAGAVWRAAPRGPRTQRRVGHATVWTGTELVVITAYGGRAGRPLDGIAYDPATRSWRQVAASPAGATAPVAASWTGREVVVLAGHEEPVALAYDPTRDSWRGFAAPPSRGSVAAVTWTGREVLAVSSRAAQPVAHLDPAGGTWRRGPASPIAPHREPAPAAWTGQEWIVHGGRGGQGQGTDGAAYDPATRTWRAVDPPAGRLDAAVDTGWDAHPLLVAGPDGPGSDAPMAVRLYDAGARTWRTLPPPPPALDSVHAAVWTGTQLLVWSRQGVAAGFAPEPGGRDSRHRQAAAAREPRP